jgi:hypothetical protein
MEKIAEALNVSKATISGDLADCSTPKQSKPAKTASNPKGAGRPKGSKRKAPAGGHLTSGSLRSQQGWQLPK